MSKFKCFLCGSSQLKKHSRKSEGKITLGSKFTFEEIYFKCSHCDWEGDLSGKTDQNYMRAKKAAQVPCAATLIDDLNNSGISMSFFERVFELPVRTLTR